MFRTSRFTVSLIALGMAVAVFSFAAERNTFRDRQAIQTELTLDVTSLVQTGKIRHLPGAIAYFAANGAAVQGTGGISGYLRGLDDIGFESAYVEAFSADSTTSGGDDSKGISRVDSDGHYLIEGLLPGKYYVMAGAKEYELLYYKNVQKMEEATTVAVEEGQISEDINFEMQRWIAGTGSIAGIVVSVRDGTPIEGASVTAYSADIPSYGYARTDEEGRYVITGLRAGRCYVTATAEGYLEQFYNHASNFLDATFVEVVDSTVTSGIDFDLETAGSISGRVTDEEGNPLKDVYMLALPAFLDSTLFDEWYKDPDYFYREGKAVTDENGEYQITGLVTSDYFVRAEMWNEWMTVVEWYDNVLTVEEATAVSVQTGEVTPGIDFSLDMEMPEGAIFGRVLDLDGDPVAEAFVSIQSADGYSPRSAVFVNAVTDENGNYRIEFVPDGMYFVSAAASDGWQYIMRWWPNTPTMADAQVVIVEDSEVGPIDFILPLEIGNASLSGRVLNDAGEPLAWASIQVSPVDRVTDPSDPVTGYFWAYANTDSFGSYTVERLPAGQYVVYASYWENMNFGQQWYDHVENREEATVITLKADQARSGIDFELAVKPIYGSIAGVVADSLSGEPVNRAYIEISPVARLDESYRPFYWGLIYAISDENGFYHVDWLFEGEYLVSVYANGSFEYYDNSIVAGQATPVMVSGGERKEIDFQLLKRSDGKGIVSGRVVSDYESQPFDIAIVTARTVSTTLQSEVYYTAVTDPDGYYEMTGLSDGEYYIMAFSPWGIGEYYDDAFDPAEATLVKVDGINPAAGIDFQLYATWFLDNEGDRADGPPTNSMVVGNVTDENGKPITGATIYVLDENGEPVLSVRTGGGGMYEIGGLPPGNYILQAAQTGYNSQYNGNVSSLAQAKSLQIGSGTMQVNFILSLVTGIKPKNEKEQSYPDSVELLGNYPNPFNPETRIVFFLPRASHIDVDIYNVSGELVLSLVDRSMGPGEHSVLWDGRNKTGQAVSSGIYIYRLEAENTVINGRMLLMR